jgi:SAM-dependent methyltransferase
MSKATWPAPERNKQPILEVLQRVLPSTGTLLEIASGSGQHAAFFAEKLPALRYLPSDVDPENLQSIRAWVEEARLPNLAPPLELDVTSATWGVGQVDAIFNANMIHIAPWECALGLISGAGRHLRTGGVLVLYGPFRIDGAHTAPSNAEFDASLRARDPRWGVRDLEALLAVAETAGLSFAERVAMPANNQTLVFSRRPAADLGALAPRSS